MSNNVRLIIGIVCAAALAALATPQLAGVLPVGAAQVIAIAIAAALHKMNADAPKVEP